MANQFIDQYFQSLRQEEIQSIRNYLKRNLSDADNKKCVTVFEKLVSGQKKEVNEKNAYNKIKSRIFDKSLEALTLDDKFLSNGLTGGDYAYIRLRKLLTQVTVLRLTINDKKTEAFKYQIKRIINEAKEYELYNIVVEGLYLLNNTYPPTFSTFKEYNANFKEIEFYSNCYNAKLRSIQRYFILILLNVFKQPITHKKTADYLLKSIAETKKEYKQTGSQNINYYLHIFQTAFYEKEKDFKGAVRECNTIIELLKNNKCLYKKERIGYTLDNISQYNIFLQNYSLAIQSSKKAQLQYRSGTYEYIKSKETEFSVHFYSNNIKPAAKVLNFLLSRSKTEAGSFFISKFNYYNICLLFQQKQFKEALLLLNEPLEIEKDKERWNIAVRIITIMINIELKDFKTASRNLQALRKFLVRNKNNDKISKRDLFIVNTLREFEKRDFVFYEDNLKLKQMLKQLNAPNTKISWEHFTPEMIKFHEWLEKKKQKTRLKKVDSKTKKTKPRLQPA